MRILYLAVALAFLLALPFQAKAAEVIRSQLKGPAAFADFVHEDLANDRRIRVDVFVTNDTAGAPGSSSRRPELLVIITETEISTATHVAEAIGSTETFAFTVGKNLANARLTASLLLVDNQGVWHDTPVQLTWTGTGEIIHEDWTLHIRDTGFLFNGQFTGKRRLAEATGSIIVEGEEFIADCTSTTAEISDTLRGSIAVVRD